MALLWIEGFEGFDTSVGGDLTDVLRKYEVPFGDETNIDLATGRISAFGAKSNGLFVELQTPNLGDIATFIIGFALFIPTAYNGIIVEIVEPGALTGINLRARTDGEFDIFLDTSLLATTSGASIGTNTWGYIELKVRTHQTLGSYDLKVNGVSEASASGIDTRTGSSDFANKINFHFRDTGGLTFDDIYILDNTGSLNNDFLGNIRVEAIFPTAEGNDDDFSASSGSNNSLMVDENPVDDDSTFVESGVFGERDLYEYGNIQLISVQGAMINTTVRETDATSFSLSTLIRSNNFNSNGTPVAIGSATYVNRHRITETDPFTAVLWTPAGINAAEFGIMVT